MCKAGRCKAAVAAGFIIQGRMVCFWVFLDQCLTWFQLVQEIWDVKGRFYKISGIRLGIHFSCISYLQCYLGEIKLNMKIVEDCSERKVPTLSLVNNFNIKMWTHNYEPSS